MRKQRLSQRPSNKLKLSPTFKLVIAGAGISIVLVFAALFSYFNIGSSKETQAGVVTGYSNTMTLTIDRTRISGSTDLVNFPVLIDITDNVLKNRQYGGSLYSAAAYDIAFSNAAGTQVLNYEIEKYEPATGRLIAWVNVPVVSVSSNTDILLYYGKSTSSANTMTTATWPSYRGVWHMDEKKTTDATSYAHNGKFTVKQIAGVAGDAADFNGTGNNQVEVQYTTSIAMNSSFTLSSWIYWKGSTTMLNGLPTASIMSRGAADDYNYDLMVQGTTLVFNYRNGAGVTKTVVSPAASVSLNTWQYVAAVYDAPNNKINLYVNGVLVKTAAETAGIKSTQTNNMFIAQRGTGTGYNFTGYLDEVRLSAGVRSADWLKTEYNNELSPGTFSGPAGGSLPIELLAFDGELQDNNTVKLQWATEVEVNNDHFTIERSMDGFTFNEMGNIPGAGNSTVQLAYEYTDAKPQNGTNYYRLKQTDSDGKFAYFDIVAVDVKGGAAPRGKDLEIVSVGPNPFTNSFSAKFNISNAGNVRMTLTDLGGKVVEEASMEAHEGENAYTFRDEGGLKPGVYILNVYDGSGSKPAVYKVVKG